MILKYEYDGDMPNVKFEYSLEKDIMNVLRVINQGSRFDSTDKNEWWFGNVPRKLVAHVRDENNQNAKRELVTHFLKEKSEGDKSLIESRITLFTAQWAWENDEYFRRLESIVHAHLPSDYSYTGYLTTAGSCPFDPQNRWFMVRIHDKIADTVAAHEILHMAFREKYGLYCRDELRLTPDEFDAMQEATTFLLNTEMRDLLSKKDGGYKEHQALRKMLEEEWMKHKDFEKLLAYYVTIKNSWKSA